MARPAASIAKSCQCMYGKRGWNVSSGSVAQVAVTVEPMERRYMGTKGNH